MFIYYFCRYCGVKVGMIEKIVYNIEVFGFNYLIVDEWKDFIYYYNSGDIVVKIICEDC